MKVAMLTYLGKESGVYTHVKNIATGISKRSNVELHIIALGDEDIIINKFGATVHIMKKLNLRGATYFHHPLLFRKKVTTHPPTAKFIIN